MRLRCALVAGTAKLSVKGVGSLCQKLKLVASQEIRNPKLNTFDFGEVRHQPRETSQISAHLASKAGSGFGVSQ
jgi:hypothetical protein